MGRESMVTATALHAWNRRRAARAAAEAAARRSATLRRGAAAAGAFALALALAAGAGWLAGRAGPDAAPLAPGAAPAERAIALRPGDSVAQRRPIAGFGLAPPHRELSVPPLLRRPRPAPVPASFLARLGDALGALPLPAPALELPAPPAARAPPPSIALDAALAAAVASGGARATAPDAPSALEAGPAGPGAVRLAWRALERSDVVYRVYWERGRSLGVTRASSFLAMGLRPGERHCYEVAAVDAEGHESWRTLPSCASAPGAAAAGPPPAPGARPR